MKIAGTVSLMMLLAAAPGLGFSAESDADRWNLKDLYATPAEWDKDAVKLEQQLQTLATCSGHLTDSVKRFKTCLDLNAEVLKRCNRLAVYASQTNDEDTGLAPGQDLKQRAETLSSRLDEASSFFNPEILQLGRSKVDSFLLKDKSLAIHRHPLDDILRTAAHTLDRKGEALIAQFGMATDAASAVFSTLSAADMPWPTVKLSDGSEVRLDQTGYEKYRALNNRADRKLVFDAFWAKWKEFERTYGVSLYQQLRRDAVYARVRRYPDSLTWVLDANKLPRSIYDTMVQQANANLPTLHRYFRLRARMLGLSELRYYDVYSPLLSSDLKYPIAVSTQLMLDAVKPLGEDYVRALELGTRSRWMDVHPRPRKRSGAYMNGAAYDVHPYLLLNHNDDYESVSTLAHEWGHAMHSYLANKAQPFITADYPTFTAEIASTTNEVLLLDHMLKTARNDDERLLYLGSQLENLRETFFKQAMFADFEREVHARVDKGDSLTGEAITKIYGDILKRYHGDQDGVVKVDDLYTIEWAYVPHFYNRFYVFQYATSIAAGNMFATQILQGTPGARERYLNILKAGGSRYPYELVQEAGVDLATPAPYQALVVHMNNIMDQIESILAKGKRPSD